VGGCRTEFTAAAAILLRFARHRCLHSQHRSDTRGAIKAKQLIQRLTTGLKGERESISDQLPMAMQAEREAQDVDEEAGIWEYTPCYLVKYGWIPHNASFGFLDLAPSILHFLVHFV
jgi:hypothetical protein